ncbi:MAG: penicillin-binding protein [Bacteroidota bacterium]
MINKRALVVAGFVFVAFILLIIKLYSIQVNNREYYTLIAERQQNKPKIVKAERGIIKDRNGEVLSFTRDNISFFVDTRMINSKKADSIVSVFSSVFGKDENYYREIISKGVRNVCLEKKVPMDKALKIKQHVIEGLFYEEDYSRVYPYGSLASHLLGYVDQKLNGVDGIEKIYDEKLTGNDGYYVIEKDVMGRTISVNDNVSKAPVSGNNLTLTINKNYQQILEEELSKGIVKYEAESALGILMDPNTGEIFALSNVPSYDPANYELFPNSVRRNRILTDTFEPGSTMKSITMSILFDQHLANPNEIINTENGTYYYKSVKISDTHPHPKLSISKILEESSNIGMAKLSFRIPDDVLYRYLRDFGFGNITSIDLPGEASGLLKKPSNFSAITKPFLSYGYEISVTPLQMIAAYGALINGGTLLQPFILKEITDSKGSVVSKTKPTIIRNVINRSTSDLMKEIMIGVVENGTGKTAQLEDVIVGGKTGTAQQLVDKSYTSKRHNSSFVGFFPADNPKVIGLILVNAPMVGKYGGLVAAPIFREAARRIIDADLSLARDKKMVERNNNIADQFIAELKSAPVSSRKSFMNIAPKKEIKDKARINISRSSTTMPNLLNSSLRDAVAQLNELGLEYKISGIGKVVSQSIEPGKKFSPGDTCVVVCEPVIRIIKGSSN